MQLARFLNKIFKKGGFILVDANSKEYIIGDPKEKPIRLKILNKNLIANGGSWNFDKIFSISDLATFLPSLNKVISFFIIKISIHYVLKLFLLINFYNYNSEIFFFSLNLLIDLDL